MLMLALIVKVPTMYRLYERPEVLLQIPNILQITVRFRISPLVT